MTCMYPPPHMACMYPPPHTCILGIATGVTGLIANALSSPPSHARRCCSHYARYVCLRVCVYLCRGCRASVCMSVGLSAAYVPVSVCLYAGYIYTHTHIIHTYVCTYIHVNVNTLYIQQASASSGWQRSRRSGMRMV